jgi:hypothetical protein
MKIVALKVYAETLKAYRDGVPKLLDMFDELSIRGSFFFGMGTEGSGSAVSKFFGERKEIVASAPGILRDASRREQDCGVYGWNPYEWQIRLEKLNDTTLEADIKRAVNYFASRTGRRPDGFAAPGFRASYMSLRIQDDVHFTYCSDTFGFFPFMPKMSWKTFRTPQIPSTLPPLEIALQRASDAEARSRLKELNGNLREGLNVLPMSAIVATLPQICVSLREFLLQCACEGVKFMGLATVMKNLDASKLPTCEVIAAQAPGMPKEVAMQSLE